MQKRTIIAGFGIATVLVAVGTAGASAGSLITTAQIKNNAVTSDKVKDGTLTMKDFKASERANLVGPAGPAGGNAVLNTVTVASPDTYVAAYGTGVVIAYCPAGTKVTGGGYFSSIAVAAASVPNVNQGWGVVINNTKNSTSVTANAYAVCA